MFWTNILRTYKKYCSSKRAANWKLMIFCHSSGLRHEKLYNFWIAHFSSLCSTISILHSVFFIHLHNRTHLTVFNLQFRQLFPFHSAFKTNHSHEWCIKLIIPLVNEQAPQMLVGVTFPRSKFNALGQWQNQHWPLIWPNIRMATANVKCAKNLSTFDVAWVPWTQLISTVQ